MSHVTHVNESCHTCESVMPLIQITLSIVGTINMPLLINHTPPIASLREWVLYTHTQIIHATCAWVMSHMWISHVTHVHESSRTCKWVMSHMWMSHVTHVNESSRTCEWVMSHVWMSHVAHINTSHLGINYYTNLSTTDPTWGDIFECCFKAQSSKLERLFSLKRGKRHVRALSFELSKMSPQVGLAVFVIARCV